MQRHDVASMLIRRFANVTCPLVSFLYNNIPIVGKRRIWISQGMRKVVDGACANYNVPDKPTKVLSTTDIIFLNFDLLYILAAW